MSDNDDEGVPKCFLLGQQIVEYLKKVIHVFNPGEDAIFRRLRDKNSLRAMKSTLIESTARCEQSRKYDKRNIHCSKPMPNLYKLQRVRNFSYIAL